MDKAAVIPGPVSARQPLTILLLRGLAAVLACAALLPAPLLAADTEPAPRVELQTSMGTMEIELFPDKSPRTVKNFLEYVTSGFYDDMIFHRVIKDWVIQAGGYDKDLTAYETRPPIRNEATNGLSNLRGTIAMAHGNDPHSADSQFYINLSDNTGLDHKVRTMTGYGYCVFGRVVRGMDVADAIGAVETRAEGGFEDLPVTPVLITRARIISPAP